MAWFLVTILWSSFEFPGIPIMLVRMLFRLGWIVQVTVAMALLSLSLWIHQQAIAGYTALPCWRSSRRCCWSPAKPW